MSLFYILDKDRNVRSVSSEEYIKWQITNGESSANDKGRVGIDVIEKENGKEGCKVSTVFLNVAWISDRNGFPLLFETMVFGGEFDGEQQRYIGWEEAEKGHAEWVKKCGGIVGQKIEEEGIDDRFEILDL